ncbi:hypothetical protein FACS189444_2610 [Spirochaetia bacterium]|nr:hypothetical protein FACS189444_2610 [Spirochaetia bacterium]GHU69819.1 hypothetical protein FACS189450_03310 [Spirochaetia bacterium]
MKVGWYCSAGVKDDCDKCGHLIEWRGPDGTIRCACLHRKYPTLEQFQEEYGRNWSGAVFARSMKEYQGTMRIPELESFRIMYMDEAKRILEPWAQIVCACTPFPIDDFEASNG